MGVESLVVVDVFGDVGWFGGHPGTENDQLGCSAVVALVGGGRMIEVDAGAELDHAAEGGLS